LQPIRGTKQYWFQKQSEVKCMVRDKCDKKHTIVKQ
jgi:hypothetical protein